MRCTTHLDLTLKATTRTTCLNKQFIPKKKPMLLPAERRPGTSFTLLLIHIPLLVICWLPGQHNEQVHGMRTWGEDGEERASSKTLPVRQVIVPARYVLTPLLLCLQTFIIAYLPQTMHYWGLHIEIKSFRNLETRDLKEPTDDGPVPPCLASLRHAYIKHAPYTHAWHLTILLYTSKVSHIFIADCCS